MKSEQRSKMTNPSASKGRKATGLSCTKSGKPGSKSAKPRQKAAGEIGKELNGQCSLSLKPPLSPALSISILQQASTCHEKFKLQLFPINDVTCRNLETERHNPYLELTIGKQKKISSIVKHLNIKWGRPKTACGELMLFPYCAQPEDLISHARWTIKDSDTSAADVHVSIGSPAIFRLRYGWILDIPPKMSQKALVLPVMENSLPTNHSGMKNAPVSEKNSCSLSSQDLGRSPADDSSNKDICCKLLTLDKTTKSQGNQRTDDSPALLRDLSNISFGALLSDISVNVNTSQFNCDSFDAAIAQYKATIQSAALPEPSILDAEETCTAFCFQKTTSSNATVPAQSRDPCNPSVSSNVQRLHDLLSSATGRLQDAACPQSLFSLQTQSTSRVCVEFDGDSLRPTENIVSEDNPLQATTGASQIENSHVGKLDMYLGESVGHLEYAAPSSKQFVGGDSIGLDGLVAGSLDAFQSFSIF